MHHERHVASDEGAELAAAGGQAEASGRCRATPLALGRVHVRPDLFAIIGQNLAIPKKAKMINYRAPFF